MASPLIKILPVYILINSAWGQLNSSVCTIVRENCGLIPPPLPRNFEMKAGVRKIINSIQTLEWEELYFDNMNLRGKYMNLANGLETHHIFNYDTEQIIKYIRLHPGVKSQQDPLADTCVAENMETSKLRYIFGYKDGQFVTKHSKMYDSYEALRYGGKYSYKSGGIGTLEERGISTNVFSGCTYDSDLKITSNNTFHFSNKYFEPAGGTPEMYIDGDASAGYLSIPLMAKYVGVRNPINKDDVKTDFDVEQSISWFRGEPDFAYDTFKIPLWLNCKNYRGAKPMKKLPEAFSTRVETTVFTQDMDGKDTAGRYVYFDIIYYDAKRKFARIDFTPVPEKDSKIKDQFGDYGPVTQIYDFNSGVTYIIHERTGKCYERSINFGDYFEASTQQMFIKMGTPEEVFLMDLEAQQYKGKYFVRDIETDVWSGKSFVERENATVVSETYKLTNGWHEEADELSQYDIPVRHTTLIDSKDDDTQTVKEVNFLKFKNAPPPMMVYDIRQCVENIKHTFLVLTLSVAPRDMESIYRYRWLFNQQIQLYIAQSSGIGTPLRVQRVQVMNVQSQYVVTFAFLERTSEKTSIKEGGLTVDEAIEKLLIFVEQEKFQFAFKLPGSDEEKVVTANGLYSMPEKSLKGSGSIDLEHLLSNLKPMYERNHFSVKEPRAVYMGDEFSKNVEIKKGMSPGGLAGLSIAMLIIGIAVGVALMYLYIRRYSEQSTSSRIPMRG